MKCCIIFTFGFLNLLHFLFPLTEVMIMQQNIEDVAALSVMFEAVKGSMVAAETILSCICKTNSLYAGVPAKKVRIVFGLSLNKKTCLFDTGVLELAIAFYPIIAGYGYGSFKLSFGFC